MSRKRKSINKERAELVEKLDNYLTWLLLISIGVVPLLVRGKVIDFTAPRIIDTVLNTGLQTDLFTYYKWVFLILMAMGVLLLIVYKIIAGNFNISPSYINIPLLLLVIFILISLLTAEYKDMALIGLYKQRNGTLANLAFLALFFAAANTVFKERIKLLINAALSIFVLINLTIILFHFFGHDIFSYESVRALLIPADYMNNSNIRGEIWATLEHPNYISGLAAALFAYFFTFFILQRELKYKLFYLLVSLFSFTIILASLSSSGFFALMAVSPLLVAIVFLSNDKKKAMIAGVLNLGLCLVIFLGMNAYNPRVFDESFGFTKQVLESSRQVITDWESPIAKAIDFSIRPVYAAESPAPAMADNTTDLTGSASIDDSFQLPAPGMGAGTGRLYIWKGTLKLIAAKPLTGYGLDTLAYYFPQNDINQIAELGTYQVVTTKPHNMYLDIAYGSGIPALLALLTLFVMHFYHTAKRLLTLKNSDAVVFPAALFLFFCTFAIQWLVNDPVIGAAAIFWPLMGVGVALNK
ncbi:MAG: O-antigen ligase family protein [Syntrophomonadaceae bacterium]|nr:O-antigen ligase family protein [Syntrophomonadaceae bacterium]